MFLLGLMLMFFQAGVISEWASDGKRFLLEHFDTINKSPSHIYHSALPLSPSTSWVYKHYIVEVSPMVKVVRGLVDGWGVCFRTTQLGSYPWALSHHNNNIAAGSVSGDINILNLTTGSQSAVLSGHKKPVRSVVFSPNGTSLVSGSYDKTVKHWDIQTGGVIKTFFGHTGAVFSVSVSVGWTIIASGSSDRTIHLWNIQTGECYHTIQQQGMVSHVSFSPKDPQHLISISGDKVWQWGVNGNQIRPPFKSSCVAFSSDGAQFVSYYKKTTIHDSSSGAIVTEFQIAEYATQCCFSPDNRLVAVATGNTAHCWDITTSEPQLVETFIGHTKKITSIIFSSSATLISASEDGSIKFWQIGTVIDLKPIHLPSTPIKSVTLLSKEDVAITCDLDGVIKAWEISTGICKKSCQSPAKHFDCWDTQLVDSKLIIVWCSHRKVCVWDTEDRQLLWEVAGPAMYGGCIRISGDKSKVFGWFGSYLWAWSLWTGKVVEQMTIDSQGSSESLIDGQGSSGSLIVDGSKVWAHWSESDGQGWDFGATGMAPVVLSSCPIPHSPSRLWNPKLARIENSATGKVVLQLSRRFSRPVSVQCDGSYLVAGYESGEILILDLTNVK